MRFFYCRPERNITSDFPPRASPPEFGDWAAQHHMARITPLGDWEDFCTSFQPVWPEWTPPTETYSPLINNKPSIAEWKPGSYALCEEARTFGGPCK